MIVNPVSSFQIIVHTNDQTYKYFELQKKYINTIQYIYSEEFRQIFNYRINF